MARGGDKAKCDMRMRSTHSNLISLTARIDKVNTDLTARIDQQTLRIDALTVQVSTLTQEVSQLQRDREVTADILHRLTQLEAKVAA